MYLLDTCVIINHLRKKTSINALPISFEKPFFISIISWSELTNGAYLSQRPEHHLSILSSFLDKLGITIINLDTKIIDVYSKNMARLQKKGEKLDHFDLLIGATALEKELILVTENAKHFERLSGIQLVS